MAQYLLGKELSSEATAVLSAGKELWRNYFSHIDTRNVRDKLKLSRTDVGWYQIRNALKVRGETGKTPPVNFSVMDAAYQTLSEKLRPEVIELGFLR